MDRQSVDSSFVNDLTTGPTPMEPVSNVQVIAEALAAHRDQLVPDAPVQLATLWGKELEGASPEIAKEIVRARLADPAWGHFRRDGARPAPAAQQQAAPTVGVFGPRAAEVVASGARVDAALKAGLAAARQSASPGLAGTYSPV